MIFIQPSTNLGTNIVPVKRERNIRCNEAGLVTAIKATTVKRKSVKRLGAYHLGHGIGKLDFIARPAGLSFQHAHDLGLKDVSAWDHEV